MGELTRDQLLEAARTAHIDRAPITIPELGGTIYVRGMSGKERDRTEEAFRIKRGARAGQTDLRNFRAFMACRVIVDKDGQRLLNDNDVDVIGRLKSGLLDRILAKMNELSGTTDEEIDELGNGSASQAASDDSASSSLSN